MESPGFSKPVHGYGQSSGSQFSPDQLLGAKFDTPDQTGKLLGFEPLDENWAGAGFEQPYTEPECNLCPTPCLGCEKWEPK